MSNFFRNIRTFFYSLVFVISYNLCVCYGELWTFCTPFIKYYPFELYCILSVLYSIREKPCLA